MPPTRHARREAAHSASTMRAMRHDGGHLGNMHGRPPAPRPPALTKGQREAVRLWATANLPASPTSLLRRAEAVLATHPDAESPGYSPAKAALQRVRAELAGRPNS